ncbi:MAG: hypothetical protein R3C68_15825 [Myxococcota bacterium]
MTSLLLFPQWKDRFGFDAQTNLAPKVGVFVVLPNCSTQEPPPDITTDTPPLCDPASESCSYRYVEAEAQTITPPMSVASTNDASGAAYVRSDVANEGQVEFVVNVLKAGEYLIWARVLASTATGDSFFVSANGGAEDVYDVAEGTWSNQWQWTRVNGRDGGAALSLNPRIFDLSAGTNTITFRGREAGAGLDVILVTNDASFIPTDAACDDGIVNSGGCTSTCLPAAEICDDGIDNDCDGDIDAADANCQETAGCPESYVVVNPDSEHPDELTVLVNDSEGNPVRCVRVDLNLDGAGCVGTRIFPPTGLLLLLGWLFLSRRPRKRHFMHSCGPYE